MPQTDYSREQALAEAYKRGILPQEMATAYEQALERGLIKNNTDGYYTTVVTFGSDYEYDTRPEVKKKSMNVERQLRTL
jgi:hypothetical protein